MGQDEATVGAEADVGDSWVVFVDEGTEALARGGIPYTTSRLLATAKSRKRERLHIHKAVSGTAHDQRAIPTKVDSTDWVAVCW
jgi:hypothetical protein